MSINFSLFDAHFHIIDDRFPLVENNGYLPKIFTCEHYLSRLQGINLVGGAVISGSFQAYDHTYIVEALNQLGPRYASVIQINKNITDENIVKLEKIGVRGIRFNLVRNTAPDIDELIKLALRAYEVANLHTEFYIESAHLKRIFQKIIKLPSISIDHLGLTKEGFGDLLKLAEKNAKIKATGFGRANFEVANALKKLYFVNPNCLMFGTDLPSTRAPRPFDRSDIDLVLDNFDQPAIDRILFKNAVNFYRV